jgi:type VI secretion system protein ImpA
MGAVDIKGLLETITPDHPCGSDLRNDILTFELESAARGKPARLEGDKEISAEEPDWTKVGELAQALLRRSKDLRVVMHLTRSLIQTEGYAGFAAGLKLLRGLIVDHWEFVYPRLDPEDKLDPTERLNILEELNDTQKLLLYIRTATLVTSRELGRFSLRDHDIASGKQPVPVGAVAPALASIEGCFKAAELDSLRATGVAIEQCLAALGAIDVALTAKLAPDPPPNFSHLVQNLKNAQKLIDTSLKQRSGVDLGTLDEPGSDHPIVVAVPTGIAGPGTIRSREDCIKALDLVADYFRKHERSSPIPLLLERAKRLMTKDFLEIMQDIAPDGVSQGVRHGSEENVMDNRFFFKEVDHG